MKPPLRLSKDYLRRLSIFAILALNFGIALSYVFIWLIAGKQDLFWRSDFTAFYTGGSIVVLGRGSDLYNKELQTQLQGEILDGRSFQDGVLLYNYPPHAVFPFTLLAGLPLLKAYYVWSFVQLILLAWLIHILLRLTRNFSSIERWLIISAILALPSLLINVLLGAFSLFILNCLLESYLALINDRELSSGSWLGAGFVKPQSLILPVMMFAGARRWRALAGIIAVNLIALLITSIAFGWRIWIDYAQIVLSTGRNFNRYGVFPETMYNLKGLLTLQLGNEHAVLINAISIIAFISVSILAFVVWIKTWDVSRPNFELKLAITLLAGLFFSLHLNPQDGLLFIVPFYLFFLYLRKNKMLVMFFSVFTLLCPVVFLIADFTIAGNFGIRIQTLTMLVLGVWMVKSLQADARIK